MYSARARVSASRRSAVAAPSFPQVPVQVAVLQELGECGLDYDVGEPVGHLALREELVP